MKKDRWNIEGDSIVWYVDDQKEHIDDIEMTGLGAAIVYQYGIKDGGAAFFNHHCVWPNLRLKPNDTHASLQYDVTQEFMPKIIVDGSETDLYPQQFRINGIVESISYDGNKSIEVTKTVFPAVKEKNLYEIDKIKNISDKSVSVEISADAQKSVGYMMGTKGTYMTVVICDKPDKIILAPGEQFEYTVTITSKIMNKEFVLKNPHDELILRKRRIEDICGDAVLDTGNKYIDLMYRFCKLRTGEGVTGTKNGLFHSPGGCRFYASSFCNDQIEYATSWFSYVHDDIIEQSVADMISHFQGFLGTTEDNFIPDGVFCHADEDPEYKKRFGNFIPSSVICEGQDYWKLDRGDEAMFAYGVSHYLLGRGSRELLNRFYKAAEFCVDYCLKRKTKDGIIKSAFDELEGRFKSGEANLSTSSLTYAALKNMKYLAKEYGDLKKAEYYKNEEEELRKNINKYFGFNMKGFETYRYYEGNDKLRAWICIPLSFGIDERKEGTKDALLSDILWTENGIYTEEGNITIWDRATLYALRGIMKVGYVKEGIERLETYSHERLVRERTPYAVEAIRSEDGRGWLGESKKSHLSAESCLLCLAVTDGLLGIEGTGLHSFKFRPILPDNLEHIYLTDIYSFGEIFDIRIDKDGYKVLIADRVISEGKLGEEVYIDFN